MNLRISAFARAVIVGLSIGASACEDSSTMLRTGPTAAAPFQARLVSVEPATIVPEFLPSPLCRTLPPFRTQFNLAVHTDRNLFLRRFRFELRDPSGRRALPLAVPTSVPLAMPTSPAVPIPGTLPFHGAAVSPPFSIIGLLLTFDCGIPAEGTLFIDVETADQDGIPDVSRVSVRMARSAR